MDSDFSTLRQNAGMTIKQCADLLKVAVATAYRYDSGESKPRALELAALRGMAKARPKNKKNASDGWFTFIDLFAGIGGLRRGFETIGGKCVFTCEWDKHAEITYRANFRCDHTFAHDIREVEKDKVPDHDMLLAGFPCQPFSIAGVSKKNALNRPHGFACETQGTLFFELSEIIRLKKPAAFLLENVKNLVSHDKGKTFATIRYVLENELGYKIDFRVIDAKHFVPQHRERIIIVGFRDGDKPDLSKLKLPGVSNGPKLRTILHPEDGSEVPDQIYTVGNSARVADKYTLTENLWKYLQAYAAKHKAQGNGFGFSLVGPDDVARTLSARYYKDGSEILVKQNNKRPRRLTPRECARLMGFDEPTGSDFVINVSDTQAYRQFGNSVAVPVIEAVANFIEPRLRQALSRQSVAA
ncbi:MAG: DNA (cytosine-5-)-methyltransferase [Alphaproteobacteria bacterium]|nr:DNA (cytosine-5-)-methyltransferase [Alphaproteobacteria bacterium]